MNLSINEYLRNPQGKGSVTLGLNQLKEEYTKRYNILIDKYGKFDTKIYKDGKSYFIHIKLPSETYPNVIYDTIIKFTEGRFNYSSDKSVLDWTIQVMTTSPSFNFSFANIFKVNGLLIDDLKFMIDSEAYRNKSKIRNPYGLIGPEKNIYFCMMYIKEHYQMIDTLNRLSTKYDVKTLRRELPNIGKILQQIDFEQAKMAQVKKKERENEKAKINNLRKISTNEQTNTVKNLDSVKNVKPVPKVKTNTNRVKVLKKK